MNPVIFRVAIGVIILAIIGLFVWLYFSSSKLVEIENEEEKAMVDDSVRETAEAEKNGGEQKVEEEPAPVPEIPEEAQDEQEEEQEDSAPAENTEQEEEEADDAPAFTRNVELINWGFATTGRQEIDTIMIHSVYDKAGSDPFDRESILNIFKSYDVSAHYVIDREGSVYQLVAEKNVSWHAGAGKMRDGRTNINAFSIGIELISSEDTSPTSEQYTALNDLIADIKTRRPIKFIVGHSDTAPDRKSDPWNFDWSKIGGKRL